MSPAVKYTLGRLGLFVGSFVVLLPVPLNILVKAMVAFVASAALSFLLLRKWRDEMAEQLGSIAAKRTAEKDRLRSALAGDEEAAAVGDRVAAADGAHDRLADDRAADGLAAGGRDAGDWVTSERVVGEQATLEGVASEEAAIKRASETRS
ncbi:hypothetical protein ACTI_23390 [Actinoplanes sp. OR16]|uniref:DUF4229 domain-containing protein n=1 Tax=Actinoplanes sp. OR16 TaxID=946334 RepID=UPI000F6C03CF|nr:DUF4229 domain-containing protein [Actinoplanes sp. OR16]BBH65654.1 hypothetical protein ACTI_23390 [Actinoplanes sp. OR16]